ncbi:MAG: hypothetical protein AAF465_15025 [Pseudomonadota bacterium]
MNRKLLVLMILLTVYSRYVWAESTESRPDVLRQAIREDAYIQAIMGALKEKHFKCPIFDSITATAGVTIMKEVEPYVYSPRSGEFSLQPGRLQIHLNCVNNIAVTVDALYDERVGYTPLVNSVRKLSFEYGGYGIIFRWLKPTGGTSEEAILNDPLLTHIYPMLSNHFSACSKPSVEWQEHDGSLEYVMDYEKNKHEYKSFVLGFRCQTSGGVRSHRASGRYFPQTGNVIWIELTAYTLAID